MSCLFCKIVAGELPAKLVHEDDEVMAFDDIHPQAPLHVLVIPKRHISTLNDLTPADSGLMGNLMTRAAAVAKERGFDASGYRTVINCNGDGGQAVYHIHVHVLGGRRLAWPPG